MLNNFFHKTKSYSPLYAFLFIFMPLLFFGIPPLYGDDVHFLETIRDHGLWHGVITWLHHYGLGYRPISITFLYVVYYCFGISSWSLYLFSFCLYGFFLWSIWFSFKPFLKTFNNRFFLLLFSATFFLNPTAYLQLSSMGMILGNACGILFISHLLKNSKNLTFKRYSFYVIIWMLLLYNYEQVVGLISLLPAWILINNYSKKGLKNSLVSAIKPSLVFAIPTLFFLGTYFSSQKNPKIVTLKKLNKEVSSPLKSSTKKPPAKKVVKSVTETKLPTKEVQQEPKKTITKAQKKSRLSYMLMKIKKVFLFFSSNFQYFFSQLDTYFGLFLLLALSLLGISMVLLSPSTVERRQVALSQILFGGIWCASTLGPFLLYKKVHVPPYVLLLPSVGIGLLLLGALNLFKKNFLLKLATVLVILLCPIQQFAYLYGLNEELRYWDKTVDFLKEKKLLNNNVSLQIESMPQKTNTHIFWLEQAIGIRYFKSKFDSHGVNLSVHHKAERNLLLISRDNAPSIMKINFKN